MPGSRYVLNPFALPDETVGRYRLMVLAALILANAAATTVRALIAVDDPASSGSPLAPMVTLDDPRFFEAHQHYALSLIGHMVHEVWPGAVGMAAVWWLGKAIQSRYPKWLRRQQAAQPLDPASPKSAGLTGLVRQAAGTGQLPALEECGTLASQHAQVYGSDLKPVLLVGRGLQLQAYRDPEGTIAVLHHELAHVANGDVGKTYGAWSLFLAAGAATLLPLVGAILAVMSWRFVAALGSGSVDRFPTTNLPTGTLVLTQGVASAALLALALAGFLRARETYADWRAATRGQHQALLSILERNAGQHPKGRTWWRPALHPSPTTRIAALRHPLRLFGLDPEVALLAGALSGLTFPTLGVIAAQAGQALIGVGTAAASISAAAGGLELAFSALSFGFLAPLAVIGAALLAAAYLLSSTWGLSVQRAALAVAVPGENSHEGYKALLLPSALMVAGVQLGAALLPLGVFSPLSLYLMRGGSGADPLTMAPWSGAACAVFWGCLALTRFWSLRYLGAHLGPHRPVWKQRFLSAVLAVLMAPLAVSFVGGQWLSSLPTTLATNAAAAAPSGVLLLAAFLFLAFLLVAFGFAACWIVWLFSRRSQTACLTCGSALPSPVTAHTPCPSCATPAGSWLYLALDPPMVQK